MNRRLTKTTNRLPPPTKSEAAFERALEEFALGAAQDRTGANPSDSDVTPREGSVTLSRSKGFIDDLFARKNEFLADDRFRNIPHADYFYTKIVGISFDGRQDVVVGLIEGAELSLERQPDNAYDQNAIAVKHGLLQVGFISKGIAKHLAAQIDAGQLYTAWVGSVTGGSGKTYGVNILIQRARNSLTTQIRSSPNDKFPAGRAQIRHALIGENQLRASQEAVLERVAGGKRTLAVLGTGRGKSYCFQYPAAVRALESSQKTLVIYPLRALANDQFEAMTRRLSGLGLRMLRANGSITAEERSELTSALASGTWDIILSTPEFLQFHFTEFDGRSRPNFIVVDEAHHLFESRHRAAYGKLGRMIERLGTPDVLALTATAGDDAFDHILSELKIESWVIDPTIRKNLELVDSRGTRNKEEYLKNLFRAGNRGIVYCNSRTGASRVAEELRGDLGNCVAFYHAGLGNPERLGVEDLFRRGDLQIVVATSAFGEGIDLPDVRDVVLYHLNFDFTEFNQQCGRAGRDGAHANIHLLYGEQDRRINDFIIARRAPSLSTLRSIYKGMKGLTMDGRLSLPFAEIARILDLNMADAATISTATRIFADANLIEVQETDRDRVLIFLQSSQRVDLERNERYLEGLAEREAFERFCDLALSASRSVLERIINRPIYPSNRPLVR